MHLDKEKTAECSSMERGVTLALLPHKFRVVICNFSCNSVTVTYLIQTQASIGPEGIAGARRKEAELCEGCGGLSSA